MGSPEMPKQFKDRVWELYLLLAEKCPPITPWKEVFDAAVTGAEQFDKLLAAHWDKPEGAVGQYALGSLAEKLQAAWEQENPECPEYRSESPELPPLHRRYGEKRNVGKEPEKAEEPKESDCETPSLCRQCCKPLTTILTVVTADGFTYHIRNCPDDHRSWLKL